METLSTTRKVFPIIIKSDQSIPYLHRKVKKQRYWRNLVI